VSATSGAGEASRSRLTGGATAERSLREPLPSHALHSAPSILELAWPAWRLLALTLEHAREASACDNTEANTRSSRTAVPELEPYGEPEMPNPRFQLAPALGRPLRGLRRAAQLKRIVGLT